MFFLTLKEKKKAKMRAKISLFKIKESNNKY